MKLEVHRVGPATLSKTKEALWLSGHLKSDVIKSREEKGPKDPMTFLPDTDRIHDNSRPWEIRNTRTLVSKTSRAF